MNDFDLNEMLNRPIGSDDVSGMIEPVFEKKKTKTKAKSISMEEIRNRKKIVPPEDELTPFSLDDEPVVPVKLVKTETQEKKKRPPHFLSTDDKKFIDDNAGRLTLDEIVQELGRTRQAVFNYMYKNGLLSEEDTRDARIKRVILSNLHSSTWWQDYKKSLSDTERKRFEDEWHEMIMQFDQNIQPSEKMQLKQALDLGIQLDRLAVAEHRANVEVLEYQQQIDELKDEINELRVEIRENKDDPEAKDFLKQQIEVKNTEIQANMQMKVGSSQLRGTFTRDRKDMLATHGKLLEQLKATREKRVDSFDVSDRTWSKMLLAIKDKPLRKKQMYAVAFCADLAVKRMRELHSQQAYLYADGDAHPPILIPDASNDTSFSEMVESLYVPTHNDTLDMENTDDDQEET